MRGVEHISDLVLEQLKEVLDAYAARNEAKALEVWGRDGAIDTMYTSLFRELLTYMMEDPRNISVCTHLLFCAKNIERIGDHATNIAEIIFYMVTGENLPETRPRRTPPATPHCPSRAAPPFRADRQRRPAHTEDGARSPDSDG